MEKIKLKATLQKDYYGKAYVLTHDNGNFELLSYDTIVCGYYFNDRTCALEFKKLWNGYSRTTANHINDFRRIIGDAKLCKKEWDALPCDNKSKFRIYGKSIFGQGYRVSTIFDNEDDAWSYADTLNEQSSGNWAYTVEEVC